MIIVGLTGGIGSGKTTIGKMFFDLGVPIYNSDKQAKKLMHSSKKMRKSIIALFGKEAYTNKKLNRAFVAEKVFNDKILLNQLNEIVHPAVRKHFKSWVEKQDSQYVIQEAAIIFEHKNQDFYDTIILVTAPKEERIRRVLAQDENLLKSQVEKRMKNQLPDSDKIYLADFVIVNQDLEKSKKEVLKIHKRIIDIC